MRLTRREAVRGLSSIAAIGGSSLALAAGSGCSTTPAPKSMGRIALLSPLTGARAETGRSIEQAFRLALPGAVTLRVHDTRTTAAGAAAAGKQAARDKPDLVVGPASTDEVRAVKSIAPLIALSNDESLRSSGVFVLGVTPGQSTGALFTYARDRGVRTVAVLRTGSVWSQQCEAAALVSAAASGMRVLARMDFAADRDFTKLADDLRISGGGDLPNAILIADGGIVLARAAGALADAGIQLLGTSQWSEEDMAIPAAAGAWIAAPDPEASRPFADAYRKQFGAYPGSIAGLAFDAASMAAVLTRSSALNAAGLTRKEGFGGVFGPFRFLSTGIAQRRLAIMVASAAGARVISGGPARWA